MKQPGFFTMYFKSSCSIRKVILRFVSSKFMHINLVQHEQKHKTAKVRTTNKCRQKKKKHTPKILLSISNPKYSHLQEPSPSF